MRCDTKFLVHVIHPHANPQVRPRPCHECGVNVIVVYRELAEGQNGRDGTKEVQFLETHHLD